MEKRLIAKLAIKSMSFLKERGTRRDRVAVLSQRVASLREQNAAMKKREKNLEDAKEQVRFINST